MTSGTASLALWIVAAVLALLALLGFAGLALWSALSAPERQAVAAMIGPQAGVLALVIALLLLALGLLVRSWHAAYPAVALRAAEALRVIRSANPQHRLTPLGGPEMRELAAAVNEIGDAYAALAGDVAARVADANAQLAQQNNRLAALMSELPQGVVVCNSEGRILLYNARAAQLLQGDADPADVPLIGLGRTLFGVVDRALVAHALDRITQRLPQQRAEAMAQFVTARAGRLLRARMAPVLGIPSDREPADAAIEGFVLVLEDITQSIEADSRRDVLLQQLTEGIRASLANIRAAAETMQQYPDMEPQRRDRFIEVVRAEAEALSQRLQSAIAAEAASTSTVWPHENMLASDLIVALQRSIGSALQLPVQCEPAHAALWLNVDGFSLVQALTRLAARLHRATGLQALRIEASLQGRFAQLALCWSGSPLEPQQWRDWQGDPITAGGGPATETVADVLARHRAALWNRIDRGGSAHRLVVQLPAIDPVPAHSSAAAIDSRPVYYDFDLLGERGAAMALDERPLAALSYTVFDCETTGLAPSEGDEIVSIGAVRIVNGRLLAHESFERLIDPRRPVRRAAQAIHGISQQMLEGQPGIDQVLPQLHRFAEDTVLVAHNAAFDLRFLQLKEASSGVRFEQPVLDTLLLSALAHPGQPESEHRLERIAARLGVPVLGRHTALGDAMLTAEVFLRLLPLLEQQGIRTLGQAREASRRTSYARLQY